MEMAIIEKKLETGRVSNLCILWKNIYLHNNILKNRINKIFHISEFDYRIVFKCSLNYFICTKLNILNYINT
jgi:hypothetical protein